jgi:hypothetical protein
MDHAHSSVLHGHDWAVAAWTIVILAIVLGMISNQILLLATADSRFGAAPMTSAAREVTTVARLAIPHHDTFPGVLTIPFAVTRVQRMMVARVKHRTEDVARDQQLQGEAKPGPRLLTGLALLGASQSSSH